MPHILCIGDLHYKENALPEMSLVEARLLSVIDRLLEEKQLDIIMVLGDLCDSFERGKISEITAATTFLNILRGKVYTILIIGNHDRENNSVFLTDRSFFGATRYWDNFLLVDTVKEFVVKGRRFLACPYVYPGRFVEALESHLPSIADIQDYTAVFAHQEFHNCKLGIVRSEMGDEWSLDYPLVVSGHIHDYDRLQPNIIYTGTPRQVSFGESSKKTISLFSFSNEGWQEERINLNLPNKEIIHVNVTEFMSSPIIAAITAECKGFIKIIIDGTAEELKHITKHHAYKRLKELGINISTKVFKETVSVVPVAAIKSIDRKDVNAEFNKRLQQDPELYETFKMATSTITLNIKK